MRRFVPVLLCLILAFLLFFPGLKGSAKTKDDKRNLVSQSIVIAGLYGGGGNNAASQYSHDYVILFNRGESPVSLSGWSTQYASVTGTNWLVTPLSGVTLAPGQYYLIQYAGGTVSGPPALPSPDLVAPVAPGETFIPNLSATNGKLALVNSTVKLPAEPCPSNASIIDMVGYGPSASCFEGAPTPVVSNTTAATRNANGCSETDHNFNDFTIGNPVPKNTGSPTNSCGIGSTLQASAIASPNTLSPGETSLVTVTVVPASSPPSTGVAVIADMRNIGGVINQALTDDGTNGDATPGDNIYSYLATVPLGTGGGLKTVPIGVADAQARTVSTSVNITVNAPLPGDDPLVLGNPSNATTDTANENNYLMYKPQYTLAYSRANAHANWVAWRLASEWIGSTPRQDDFRADTTLPAGWYRVLDTDYSGSGFSRGHMCPSGDRTNSVVNNSGTFLMTNMIPQITENNSGSWNDFENYLRTLASQGKEIYTFSGGLGTRGRIANNQVNVPAFTWKVVMVLENGDNDLQRVNKGTRTIAIVVPNSLPLNQSAPWRSFRTRVDSVEALTGFDFFSLVPKNTQEIIERRRDTL